VEPEVLRDYMRRKHLTHPDLARITGKHLSTVRMWTHKKGPGFRPCPDKDWEKIRAEYGD